MNDKDKLLEELGEFKDSSNNKSFYIEFLFIILLTIYISIHVGEMLFGVNSIEVLSSLKESKKTLNQEVNRFKEENAKLQKIFFEERELKPLINEINITEDDENLTK